MTEKFEAFKEALQALCVEHGVHLRGGDDYDDQGVYFAQSSDSLPAGATFWLEEVIAPTLEEIAAEEARKAAAQAEWNAKWAEKWDGSYIKHHFELLDSMSLEEKQAMIAANAEEQRKKNMRVTRIPGDQYDIGDRPCRVYCNEIQIEGWTVADDFRRVVETPGKVHHGAVRIDLEGHEAAVSIETPAAMPINSLSGMFVPEPKPVAPAVKTVEATPVPVQAPMPNFAAPTVNVTPKARPKTPARKRKSGR